MSKWPQEKIRRLVALREAGYTFLQIGKELGMTRSAIAGMCSRQNVKTPERSKPPAAPRKKVAPTDARPKAPVVIDIADNTEVVELVVRRKAPAPFPARSILDLRNHQCKWPVGDPKSSDFHFCSQPVQDLRCYCKAHCELAYVPLKPSTSATKKLFRLTAIR